MTSRGITSYNNQSKQSLAGAKLLAVGEINIIQSGSPNLHATVCATATPQEIMYSPTGNFANQGGASWDAIITPFQIGAASSRLPTMPTTAGQGCVKSQSNQVDPPINEWTPPVINISYLNPFMAAGAAAHGDATHYDGTILFNGGTSSDQNLINAGSVPSDLRPMALRGPLVIQGWGYDLNGKPIPNKVDNETSARQGTFETGSLKDQFLDKWTEKRETWPVAPVDLRYDRTRKVWTVPSTFRIIKTTAEAEIAVGNTGSAVPNNINAVYDSDGNEETEPTIIVNNPSFSKTIASGEQFFSFYDTKDCEYYPLVAKSSGSCININRVSGCYSQSYYDPEDTYIPYNSLQLGSGLIGIPFERSGECSGSGLIIKTMHKFSGMPFTNIVPGPGINATDNGCGSFTISTTGAAASCPTIAGTGTVTVTEGVGCDFVVSGAPTIVKATGCASVTGPAIDGNQSTYTVSGHRTTIVAQGSITASESGECGYIVSGCDAAVTGAGANTVTVSEAGGCKTYTVSGCDPVIQGTGNTTVTSSTDGNCKTYTVSGCEPVVVGDGSNTVTVSEAGGCKTYTVSGCQDSFTPAGSISITSSDVGDCKSYTISGCEPVVVGDGSNTVTVSEVGGCKTYTVSGCETTLVGGSGIQVTPTEGCGYTIDFDGCRNTVASTDSCIIVNEQSVGDCSRFDLSLDTDCITSVVEAGDISVTNVGNVYTVSGCNSAVTGGTNVTVTSATSAGCTTYTVNASGCKPSFTGKGGITVTDVGDYCNQVVTISGCETSVTGVGNISVTDDGDCGFTISGCQDTFTQAGTVTITSSSNGDCKDYTVSGCPPTFEGIGGITVTQAGGDCGTVTISGQYTSGTAPQYKDTNYCDHTASITSCTEIACLTFGEGLQLAGTTVSAPVLHVQGDWASCGSAAAGEHDATKILFSDNLIATRANCAWTVKGVDQKVSSTRNTAVTNCMAQGADVADTDFKKLAFTDNIGVAVSDCVATIKGLDQKISSTRNAAVTNCMAQAADVAATDFTTMAFTDNIGVAVADCTATIKGLDQKVSSVRNTAVTNCMAQGADVVATDFTTIAFTDNIGLAVADCTATVKGLDQKVSSVRNAAVTNCMAQGADIVATDFTTIAFTDNIGLAVADCTATVKGLDQKISSTRNAAVTNCMAQAADVAATDFTTIAFTDNIGVSVAGCAATVKGLDQKVAGDAAGYCNVGEAAADFTTLNFRHGFNVSHNACTSTIDSVFKVSNHSGVEQEDNTCHLTMGCGMDATANPSVNGEVQLHLKETLPSIPDRTVQLVKDICCSGNGFDIKYTTLTFSSCGQLLSVDKGDDC
jgi:hypothetical protein